MRKWTLLLFFTVALGELLADVIKSAELHLICKPMIMITLGIYYLINTSNHRSTLVLLAILFSFVGDTALMFESSESLFFMLGLGAFLISHVFYILAYRQHQYQRIGDALHGIRKIRFAFPIVLAGTGLIVILYPTLGALKFPVMVYALVLVLMVLNGLFRYGRTTNKSFWMVFGGAVLFMVSDSLLAIDKFLQSIAHPGLLIMSTYISAQFLIVEGLSSHANTSENNS